MLDTSAVYNFQTLRNNAEADIYEKHSWSGDLGCYVVVDV